MFTMPVVKPIAATSAWDRFSEEDCSVCSGVKGHHKGQCVRGVIAGQIELATSSEVVPQSSAALRRAGH